QRWHEQEGHPLYMVKDAAHNANDDNPGEVNEIIASFLRTL
ncbi:MAG: alpha/beta hydrolase, partial [Syntrophomonadaceae bacterium]|nr:alpha/beta hydrolase [Syntrophomonadaceae bacterium]